MVSLIDVYHVVEAIFPLYAAMILAYASVKWWKLFTADQCSGINKFVARFSIPLLSFQVISSNSPYKMNLKLICADLLQKFLAFFVLTVIAKINSRGSLSWVITGLSLSTLPNTLILGIPLLRAMYGAEAAGFLAQIVALQSLIWYNLLLLLFEINAARGVDATPPSTVTEELEAPEAASQKDEEEDEPNNSQGKKSKIALLLSTVGRKLISNPNTHGTLAGLVWACIHFRWGLQLPKIVGRSITVLSDGGLGMAMFSLGLFMASQTGILACGTRKALLAMAMRFVVGPVVMAGCSIAVGLRGRSFKVAVVQAALPQGIVPFVFAKEYHVHPDILSTGVLMGMLIATPIALAYYYLLALL